MSDKMQEALVWCDSVFGAMLQDRRNKNFWSESQILNARVCVARALGKEIPVVFGKPDDPLVVLNRQLQADNAKLRGLLEQCVPYIEQCYPPDDAMPHVCGSPYSQCDAICAERYHTSCILNEIRVALKEGGGE